MANWYVKTTGNAANSGTSDLLAVDKLPSLAGKGVATGDIVFVDEGVYNWGLPTGTFTVVLGAVSVYIKPYPSATTRPVQNIVKDPANPTFSWALTSGPNTAVERMAWDFDYSGTSNNTQLIVFGSQNPKVIDNDIYLHKSDNTTVAHQMKLSSNNDNVVWFNGGRIRSDGNVFNLNPNGITGSNLLVTRINQGSTVIGFGALNKSRLHFSGVNGISLQTAGLVSNNSLFMDNASLTRAIQQPSLTQATAGMIFNNIFVAMNGTSANTSKWIDSTSAITVPGGYQMCMGNNVFFNFIAPTNLSQVNELLGISPQISDTTNISSLFLSLDPDSWDFGRTVSSSANATVQGWIDDYIKGKALNDVNGDIGATQLTSGGETDPNKVLTTSTKIVGNYIPVVATNVRKDIIFGLTETGLLDVEAEANLPLESTVDSRASNYGPLLDKVPTLDIDTEANLPVESTVEAGTGAYGRDLDKIPTLDIDTRANLPSASEVDSRAGNFGKNLDIVPTLDIDTEANLPLESTVDSRASNYGRDLDKVPTLDIDTEANLPLESVVETGSGAYGRDLNKVPSFTPDYSDPANTLENDTTNGVQGLVPLNKVAPSQGGSYLGEESNDDLDPSKVEKDFEYLNRGVLKTGLLNPSTSTIVVDENYVVYPYEYEDSEGIKIGQAGKVNENDIDVSEQIKTAMESLISQTLPDYEAMRYIIDPLKNDFFNNAKQYGVLNLNSFDDVNKLLNGDVVDYSYQITLTNDYINDHDDVAQRAAAQELINKMELLRRKLKATRAGTYNNSKLLYEFNFTVNSPDYIESDKLVILRAFFSIKAKIHI